MRRQAQAERERLARALLGRAEREVAIEFVEAAEIYARSPAALQLRAMNIIYETTKERGATILMPSAMVDATNLGGLPGGWPSQRRNGCRRWPEAGLRRADAGANMRRLDWFFAGVVATFLIAVAVMELTAFTPSHIGFNSPQASGVAEVAMRRLVNHLPRPPILGLDPQ